MAVWNFEMMSLKTCLVGSYFILQIVYLEDISNLYRYVIVFAIILTDLYIGNKETVIKTP